MSLIAGATFLVAACGGDSTTPAPVTLPVRAVPTTSPAPGGPAPSATPASAVDLFDTAYAPAAAAPGGSIIIGDWQEATQLNPYY
ncbi:MAG: hypothetical protein MUQ32_10955, partial [Chloroflexi bacterium]|nr:hypothetical protein [Chloroflexota bacterium]